MNPQTPSYVFRDKRYCTLPNTKCPTEQSDTTDSNYVHVFKCICANHPSLHRCYCKQQVGVQVAHSRSLQI